MNTIQDFLAMEPNCEGICRFGSLQAHNPDKLLHKVITHLETMTEYFCPGKPHTGRGSMQTTHTHTNEQR